jgi:hypothetical protein
MKTDRQSQRSLSSSRTDPHHGKQPGAHEAPPTRSSFSFIYFVACKKPPEERKTFFSDVVFDCLTIPHDFFSLSLLCSPAFVKGTHEDIK